MNETRKIAAILAADVVGFSRLAGADEEGILARLRALRTDLTDPAIAGRHGRVVKRTGDGLIVKFRSVVDAVRCAIEIQNGMLERNAGVAPDRRIEFRIGVHLGDVVEEPDGDLMGDGVNIAARIESIAEPGGVSLSEDAWRQVRDRMKETFADSGEQALKNIARPVRVFALSLAPPGSGSAPRHAPSPPAEPAHSSIAVLPFANMSGDAEQEYFADGISEDIITALSKLPQLFVIARNSAFTFKGKNVNVGEVGKSLGVRHVLEGSVRKAGGRVRITAQLIDATTGGHLWAERFDRELTDIFAVQDDVTSHIVSALALNLSRSDRQSIVAERTDNQEAYDCFLRGRELWWRFRPEANLEAERLLRRATALDPTFAPAFAFLAATLANAYSNGWGEKPAEALQEADKVARQAVKLDERYPYALWSLGMTLSWERRNEEALAAAEKAIGFNPNFADGNSMVGVQLHFLGRSAEAIPFIDRAMALDPHFNSLLLYFRAQALYQLGRYADAVSHLKRRILRNPETDASRVLLAASLGQMGLVDEAREAWREALGINPAYSLEQRRNVMPYKNPADFERIVEGLRKAGLPET
ncbi:MAG TPA: adenylate/guanylate cyclase domain-containing protein [Roseiarcus sp.]